MYVLKVLRGLVLNPLLVATFRGMLEAAAMAAIVVLGDQMASGNVPDEFKMWIPLGTLGLRVVEGLADKIDPAKKRRRDTLREEAVVAEITGGTAGPLNPGDVTDPEVKAQVASYENGDVQ